MIEVITAPEHKYLYPSAVKVFLAGGIQKCPEWQRQIIGSLTYDYNEIMPFDYGVNRDIVVMNPRRVEWLNEPGAAQKQIEWEFDMIEKCDLFTMYFANSESDQPICMYELGRNLERMKQRFPNDWYDRIIITCDSKYKRVKDVIVQTALATDNRISVDVVNGIDDSISAHYQSIRKALKEWTKKPLI